MFPNPQDALPLPPRPSLEQYKKRAKDLVKACRDGSIHAWGQAWVESLIRLTNLKVTPGLPVATESWVKQLDEFARTNMSSSHCALSTAQFIIARAHGFESWPKLTKHLAARANSAASIFEQAAEAIIEGDVASLTSLLRDHPDLPRARSTRRHQATLLHYVSANGIEGYRQKTPKNIVAIAALVLNSGADVNATAEVYGSPQTTLVLVATSVHPAKAVVQEALMQLLLDHGATIGPGILSACLANGRPGAAEFLAKHGAPIDLESAAGLGDLAKIKTYFLSSRPERPRAQPKGSGVEGPCVSPLISPQLIDNKANLKPTSTSQQLERGFLWACEYGRTSVVEFLLEQGVPIQTEANTGQTALHWAVIGGHQDTIATLLTAGANLEAKNKYGGTALGQALWSAIHSDETERYVAVVETVLKAGAKIEEGTLDWLDQQKSLSRQERERLVNVLQKHNAKS